MKVPSREEPIFSKSVLLKFPPQKRSSDGIVRNGGM